MVKQLKEYVIKINEDIDVKIGGALNSTYSIVSVVPIERDADGNTTKWKILVLQ